MYVLHVESFSGGGDERMKYATRKCLLCGSKIKNIRSLAKKFCLDCLAERRYQHGQYANRARKAKQIFAMIIIRPPPLSSS